MGTPTFDPPPHEDPEDTDSTLGSDASSSTASLSSSILAYRRENGRTYHAYKDGKYVVPNDEAENDRLDLEHHEWLLTLQNKLYIAPIPKEKTLNRVLDVGTGTGIWAIDFADEHPESEVIGTDLSPIQPSFVPPNLRFEIDDVEDEWIFKNKFDFIHCRMLTGSIADWPRLVKSMYDNLTPGGWVQLDDALNPIRSDDNTMPADSPLLKWSELVVDAGVKMGRSCNAALQFKEWLEAAGFEEVKEIVYKWPINPWPKDKELKEIGTWQFENLYHGISGLSMAFFTRFLGWDRAELEVFLADVRDNMKNRTMHAYFPVYVVYGKKPDTAKE